VTPELRKIALALDATALIAASLALGPYWATGLATYIVASRAYSHPAIRLKARPLMGWLTVAFFQGAWIVGLVFWAGLPLQTLSNSTYQVALASTLLFGGGYPITQIYQHAEDQKRGDLTLSRFLGARGTLLFTLLCSGLGAGVLLVTWTQRSDWISPAIFLLGASPGTVRLLSFAKKCLQNPEYVHTGTAAAQEVSRLSWWLALGMNGAFLIQIVLNSLE
jgi:1,4-dihydroxy-2-naphthoate octaprenyltransferase